MSVQGLHRAPDAARRRYELRETGAAFLDGLLSGVERKTGYLTVRWRTVANTLSMAEQCSAERPYRMQSLLGRGEAGDADGVLIVDESGFVKDSKGGAANGEHSAGVARQARNGRSNRELPAGSDGLTEGAFTLADVTAGKLDAFYVHVAQSAVAHGFPNAHMPRNNAYKGGWSVDSVGIW